MIKKSIAIAMTSLTFCFAGTNVSQEYLVKKRFDYLLSNVFHMTFPEFDDKSCEISRINGDKNYNSKITCNADKSLATAFHMDLSNVKYESFIGERKLKESISFDIKTNFHVNDDDLQNFMPNHISCVSENTMDSTNSMTSNSSCNLISNYADLDIYAKQNMKSNMVKAKNIVDLSNNIQDGLFRYINEGVRIRNELSGVINDERNIYKGCDENIKYFYRNKYKRAMDDALYYTQRNEKQYMQWLENTDYGIDELRVKVNIKKYLIEQLKERWSNNLSNNYSIVYGNVYSLALGVQREEINKDLQESLLELILNIPQLFHVHNPKDRSIEFIITSKGHVDLYKYILNEIKLAEKDENIMDNIYNFINQYTLKVIKIVK